MALVQRHPDVEDYIVELSPSDLKARPGGAADLVENGRMVILKDYRLPVDLEPLAKMSSRIDDLPDKLMIRRIKKVTAPNFFVSATRKQVTEPDGTVSVQFDEEVRHAMFVHLCHGDVELFDAVGAALKAVHEEMARLFEICYPNYKATRLIPSVRLTETIFEDLHWDNHSIDDDFHQARIFCNLDRVSRIWNVSHNFLTFMETHYEDHDLAKFAGKDPNLMINYLCTKILGGTTKFWEDKQARHRIAFAPGEVWLGESRMISHQIYHGQRAAVYMWFVEKESMCDSNNRFNARVDAMHEKMARKMANRLQPASAVAH